MNGVLAWGGLLGGALALAQFGWVVYTSVTGKQTRKMQAEAAKATIDAEQAEASLPHVQRSLELGNIAEAVTIQQGVINGLRAYNVELEQRITERDGKITELERRLTERDAKIDELERRLAAAEENFTAAKRLIRELRISRDAED